MNRARLKTLAGLLPPHFIQESVHKEIRPSDRVHISSKAVEEVESRTQSTKPGLKPVGFWYSFGKEWTEWSSRELGLNPNHSYIYSVSLTNSANIYRVQNYEDLISFSEEFSTGHTDEIAIQSQQLYQQLGVPYPASSYSGPLHSNINWARVSSNYDGFEITNYNALKQEVLRQPFVQEFRSKGAFFWFFAFDLSSGCVWNSSAIKNLTLISEPS